MFSRDLLVERGKVAFPLPWNQPFSIKPLLRGAVRSIEEAASDSDAPIKVRGMKILLDPMGGQ